MAVQSITVMEYFQVKKIQKQTGMTTGESIRAIHINLNGNAASVLIGLVRGRHCHLSLTIRGAEYQMLTSHAFLQLVNPGIIQPPGGVYELPTQCVDRAQQWEDASRAYNLCTTINTAMCNQLMSAVDETYIIGPKNQYTGYVQSTTVDIL
eukprot:15336542-Ditylum_brightwellii.AAC.1